MNKTLKKISLIITITFLFISILHSSAFAVPIFSWNSAPSSEYQYISFNEKSGYFEALSENGTTVFDSEGNKILHINGYLSGLMEDCFLVETNNAYKTINAKGATIKNFSYKSLFPLADGYMSFTESGNNKQGIVDYTGKTTLKATYDNLFYASKDRVIFEQNKKYGIIDFNGKIISDAFYDSLMYSKEDIIIANTNGKYGIIDLNGNILIPSKYDTLTYIQDDFIIASNEKGKYGIIDITQNVIEPFNYGYIIPVTDDEKVFQFYDDDKITVLKTVDINEKAYLLKKYDHMKPVKMGYAIYTQEDKKQGVLDLNGKEIIPFEYIEIQKSINDYYNCYKENGIDIRDSQGNIVYSGNELHLEDEANGIYVASQNSAWGFAKIQELSPSAKDEFTLSLNTTASSVWGEIILNDVAPIIRNDRTMLPARFIAENLGAKVNWNSKEKEVEITGKDVSITLQIGSDIAYLNGKKVKIDSPAFIENDRTYTPVRFIAENLGAKVNWDAQTKTVIIKKAN